MAEKAQQISTEQRKFNAIKERICKTERGQKLFEWLRVLEIEVKFSPDVNTPAHYIGHGLHDLKKNKAKGGTIYLDPRAPDEFIMIGFFEAMRRAWHDKVANSEAPNRSPLSHMMMQRFLDADTFSFAAAMTHDYLVSTGDGRVLQAMMQNEKLSPMMHRIGMITRYSDSVSFVKLRRAAFDAYFETYMGPVSKIEEDFTKSFLARTEPFVDKALRGEIQRVIKPFAGPLPTEMPRFDTIGAADFSYIGSDGFMPGGENYLRLDKFPPVNTTFYMMPTQPSYSMLEEFNKKFSLGLQGKNFMGSPYKLTQQDTNRLQDITQQMQKIQDSPAPIAEEDTPAPEPEATAKKKSKKKEKKKGKRFGIF